MTEIDRINSLPDEDLFQLPIDDIEDRLNAIAAELFGAEAWATEHFEAKRASGRDPADFGIAWKLARKVARRAAALRPVLDTIQRAAISSEARELALTTWFDIPPTLQVSRYTAMRAQLMAEETFSRLTESRFEKFVRRAPRIVEIARTGALAEPRGAKG